MKRRKAEAQTQSGTEAERLIYLAKGLAESGSRMEDAFWRKSLQNEITGFLRKGQEEGVLQALDRLYAENGRAYDLLADEVEAASETGTLAAPTGQMPTLLIALPVLAWSRYSIPARVLPDDILATLRVQLQAHILARDVALSLADHLLSPDQLPRGYSETMRLTERFEQTLASGDNLRMDTRALPEPGHYLSDMRLILGAISAPAAAPLFRWQEAGGNRESALEQWRSQGGESLRKLLVGSQYVLQAPDAYHAAWRRGEIEARPFSLTASTTFLCDALNAKAGDIQAVLAPTYEAELEEYRVGFLLRGSLVYGVVWPLLGAEDESSDAPAQIAATLKNAGLTDVRVLEERYAREYCEDCGMPLFPNADSELAHPEWPETAEATPGHLH
jgi:Protein of unknown function (DUF2863)